MYPKFHFKKIEIDSDTYVVGRENELMVIISNNGENTNGK